MSVWFKEKEYRSWKDCCSELLPDIPYNTICNRIKKTSWPEAIQYYLDKSKNQTNKIIFDGIEYGSWAECCKKQLPNFSYNSINTKAQRTSWPEAIEYYLNKPIKLKPRSKAVFNNKKYSSWKDCCKKLLPSVSYSSICFKARKSSWEEAIKYYLNKPKNIKSEVVFNGESFESWHDCCSKLLPGVTYINIYNKARRSSWPQAIEYYLKKTEIIFNGVKYRSWRACCKKLLPSVSYINVCVRSKKSSWPEAVKHYLVLNGKYPYKGEFIDLEEFSKDHNISLAFIEEYLLMGGCLEDLL